MSIITFLKRVFYKVQKFENKRRRRFDRTHRELNKTFQDSLKFHSFTILGPTLKEI